MSQNRGGIATISVVDDNQVARDLLETILRAHEYRLRAVGKGVKALALLKSQPADRAPLDSMVPGEGGFHLCRAAKARKETRCTPIVRMTDWGIGEEGAHQTESTEQVLGVLAGSIEDQDPYTQGHCTRIARYAVALGAQVGLPAEHLLALRRGGVLHDIGKVAIPQRVLLKPGPLNPQERLLMEAHTVIGEGICATIKSLSGVLPIVRSHHERQDGTGYPDRLKGDQIPITARIVQTVDIYDALTTDRPYRAALTPRKALRIMHDEVERGWWDGALVDVLEAMVKNSRKTFVGPMRPPVPMRGTNGRKVGLQLTA